MIPLSDSVRTRQFPWVNLLLIGASILVFVFELTLGPRLDAFVQQWGVTPSSITQIFGNASAVNKAPLVTLVTALFIHAGWLHLGSNLLFLWIFGDNVEDRLGHLRYLLFYLVCGVAANLVQVYTMPLSEVPLVGASGAIAGVLGAYVVMYPRAWVSVLVPIFFFLWPIDIPVIAMLGFWFISQLASGLAAITEASHATGGVAWWAHIGGFLVGMVLAPLIPKPRISRPTVRAGQLAAAGELPPALGVVISALSLLGDAVKLLILVRIAFRFLGLTPVGPSGFVVRLVYLWSSPLVKPFSHFLPALHVGPFVLELHSVLALLAYHILVTIAIWALTVLLRSGRRL